MQVVGAGVECGGVCLWQWHRPQFFPEDGFRGNRDSVFFIHIATRKSNAASEVKHFPAAVASWVVNCSPREAGRGFAYPSFHFQTMGEGLDTRWRRVTIHDFGGMERRLEIRALRFEELHTLLQTARDSEWYGNADLIARVIDAGVKGGKTAVGDGAFTATLAAREVWIVTLREIVSRARAIARAAGQLPTRLRIRRYRFEDLATPGMLLHLADACEDMNVDGFLFDIVDSSVVDVRIGDRTLDTAERAKKLEQWREAVARAILTTHGVDGDLSEKLPTTVFPTFAHRFVAANQLFMTLDWVQFRHAINAFNSAVDAATHCSHQLGGLDASPEKRLVTGVPLFFETVMPTRNLPFMVAPQLWADATNTSLSAFPKRDRAILRSAAKSAFGVASARIREYPSTNEVPEKDRGDILFEMMQTFIAAVSRHPLLVRRICTAYVDQFRADTNRRLRSHIDETMRDMRLLDKPDAYFLVEGPSDKIYLLRCLELYGAGDVFIAVEKQEGTSSMERRVRDLKREGAASIFTLLDADAPTFHDDLKRLLVGVTHSEAFILSRGMIEDQFLPETHAAALNAAYLHGDSVLPSDISAGVDAVTALKRAAWEKKRVSFDKVAHARAVAELLIDPEYIPSQLRSIIATVIVHAEQSRREMPRPTSYLSLDRRTLDALRSRQRADDEH